MLVSIGLILDIAGVILLFFFGLPNKIPSPEEGLPMEWGTPKDEKEERRKKLRLYKALSTLGIFLLVAGFSLQLIGNILAPC